jgi:hypothetical protein
MIPSEGRFGVPRNQFHQKSILDGFGSTVSREKALKLLSGVTRSQSGNGS